MTDQTPGWEPTIRYALMQSHPTDPDEDMIAIPRWALLLLSDPYRIAACGGENHEPTCCICQALKTADLAAKHGLTDPPNGQPNG
jgi:hypothetical protein